MMASLTAEALPCTVILDTDRLRPTQAGDHAVDSVNAYAGACLELRCAWQEKRSVTLHVRNKTVAAWFAQFVLPFGKDQLRVQPVTPRSELAVAWKLPLPKGVTDGDIRKSRLLGEEVFVREGQTFSNALLEHFYGDVFSARRFPLAHLAPWLNEYDRLHWADAASRPLVAQALKARLSQWEQTAPNDAVRSLIRQIQDDPGALRRDLSYYKALRNYPPVLSRKVLGDQWDVFRKAGVDTADLSLTVKDREAVSTEIQYYLTGVKPTIASEGDFRALLGQVSGHLFKEYVFLDGILHEHLDWLSPELLRKLEGAFRPIQAEVGSSLARLRRLIKPVYPSPPDADWTAPQWLRWVSESYMPFYAWLEIAGQPDDTMKQYASQFADWYYTHFTQIKNAEPERFAFSALYSERARMAEGEAVSLVLLIDNFNFVHFPDLCRLFNLHDFTLQSSKPLFSLIPTATEVGKASLIVASGDQADRRAETYAGLVKSEWLPLLHGKTATYLPNIGELQQLKAREHDVYFLNYLPIDRALHEDSQETGRSHADTITDHLETLTSSIADFAKRFQIEKRLAVYGISDHGSTRIARQTVNVLDQKFFKGLALEKHHRFVALVDEAFAKLPQVAGEQCYLIDRHKFKTNHNYLAARGYYRFLDTTDTFFVHGGLTPEEVVVPFARFAVAPVIPEMPTIRLREGTFRYSKRTSVEFEIGNPNGYPLEEVSLRLVDQDSEEVVRGGLGANSSEVVGLPTLFRKVPGEGNKRQITLRVRFECQGRQFSPPDASFEISLKALMEVTDDFEF